MDSRGYKYTYHVPQTLPVRIQSEIHTLEKQPTRLDIRHGWGLSVGIRV